MKFSKMYIQDAINDLGFKAFTDIQNAVIQDAIRGRDIIGCSQTGTGKTHAFLIPVFEKLQEDTHDIQTVILSPTRELAMQIYEAARHIASFSKEEIDIRLLTGGQDRQREIERLHKTQPQIVIGTPGKVHDLAIKENVLKVYRSKMFIVDEADMALEIGFLEDIDHIARTMPSTLQMLVFSATIPEALQPFLRKYMKQPKEILISDQSLANLKIEHKFIKTMDVADKDRQLLKLIDKLNPYLAMIFANKKEDVDRIAKTLYQKGVNVVALHGDIPARKRKQILKDINRLTFQYVVASDMASRGLDIDGVSHIINYDLPKDMAFYVHRIGRTGRMGRSGESISFYTDKDNHVFEFIDKHHIEVDIKGKKPRFSKRFDTQPPTTKPRKNLKVKPNYKKKLKRKKR